MTSKKLQRARDFEKKYSPYVAEELPKFHVTGGIGWINDPNGFAPYKGEYHLFYQYYPYDTKWGPMHWGHVKTKDFVRWERLPVALAPDMDYDKDGCFSGGAVEMPDGRHLLMYTGVRNVRRKNGKIDSFQTQCIAIGDGENYQKYEGNPVIRSEEIPRAAAPRISGPENLAGGRNVLCGGRKPYPGRQWHHSAVPQRGRHPLGICEQAGLLPQPVRQDVGMPGFLPSGWEARSADQPSGDDCHWSGIPSRQCHVCIIGTFDRECSHLMREKCRPLTTVGLLCPSDTGNL